ncbi:MAG TPA: carbohydrate ABC transporter permease [Clostridiaceae bacterium]|nr:carbohydrate ABC transporter permease [Clostridiaceae bacterium]
MISKHNTGISDKTVYFINYVLITIFTLIVLYPVIFVLSASFSDGNAVMHGKVWLYPVGFTTRGYEAIFKYSAIMTGYANSLYYMIVGTVLSVFMSALGAYPLSRKDFSGKKFFMILLLITMFFSGGLIPSYLLIKSLGLINTRWVMILPGLVSAYNIFVFRTYINNTIPLELFEASRMDGINDFQYLFRIVIPLSKPIMAVLALWHAVGSWNSYFTAMIYLRDRNLFPLQLFLREVLLQNVDIDVSMMDIEEVNERRQLQQLLRYSMIVAGSLPLMIAYPFIQKYFVKGVMVGSLKG